MTAHREALAAATGHDVDDHPDFDMRAFFDDGVSDEADDA